MAGNKAPRKKKRATVHPGADYIAQDFTFTKEKSYTISLKNLSRLENFKNNCASYGDRTTLMIRIYAGVKRLEDFDHDGADEVFKEALDILRDCRDKEKRIIKKLSKDQLDIIGYALSIVVEMFSHSTLWEEALAIKYGEDQLLIDAENWEYRLKEAH